MAAMHVANMDAEIRVIPASRIPQPFAGLYR
jgi:hypothetical protein